MRRTAEFRHVYDDYADTSAPGRYTRRSLLRGAVLSLTVPSENDDPWARPPVRERTVVSGRIADVSPHVLVLQTAAGEQRLTLMPETKAWRGTTVQPSALRAGDHVIVRTRRRPLAVERIWAQIGRVTGTIVESRGRELIVDEGPARGRGAVVLNAGSIRQIQVRFPWIAPGYLIDVIGLRHPGYLLALTPATAQPPYWAGHAPTPPLVNGHIPEPVSGTAVWHEPGSELPDLRGVAYPALDPETCCEHPAQHNPAQRDAGQHDAGHREALDPHNAAPGCVRLPYLSIGSTVQIRNECRELDAILPVTSCGAVSRLFCDRCLECGTSPRGRLADLTMTAFAELGGNLDHGCFNATFTLPG